MFTCSFQRCAPALALLLLLASPSLQAQTAPQAVILQYHHVSTQTPASTSISPDAFRAQINYLKDNGFTVLPLEQVVSALRTGSELPDRTAVISFDDGYFSVYETAFPILRELDFPFTIFIAADLIGSNPGLYSSWEQLRTMAAAGATLANHTMTHPYLMDRLEAENDADWLARIRSEIVGAEARIKQETGQSHQLFAYPYGEYDPQLQQLIRDLGYVGIGQHSGPINAASDFTALPRFPFSGIYASMNTYKVKVQSLAFNVAVTNPDSDITDERSPSAELDFDGSYRLDSLNCFNNDQPMKVVVLDAAAQRYRVETTVENHSRRFRYNCTAPGHEGRFYWYSIPWLNPAVAE
jgi:peptidoglycan/xylan/chitin deacetylase (PgdA/CDA1 family)